MREQIPNLSGASRIYAIFGDPVSQVLTPHLINPIFAAAGEDIYAVPFHVTPTDFPAAWDAFASMSNLAGIGITVPHKVVAARHCATLTRTAQAVGAVNAVQRGQDGGMHGALFDGTGFIEGLRGSRAALRGARVLMVGAGGAGRAIAFALAEEGVRHLALLDLDQNAVALTIAMVNAIAEPDCAFAADPSKGWAYDVVINASSIGVKGKARFPVPDDALRSTMVVADIASLTGETDLLAAARKAGATTCDGASMLEAQIRLIAGFAAGRPAGTPLGQYVRRG